LLPVLEHVELVKPKKKSKYFCTSKEKKIVLREVLLLDVLEHVEHLVFELPLLFDAIHS
jgi:hypothetical protein